MEESNTFVRQPANLEHFRNTQLLYDDFEPEIRSVVGRARR